MLALLPRLPRLHVSKLAKEFTCSVECQILAILIIEVVARVLLVAWVDTPYFGTVVIPWHACGDKIALMLTEVTASCMRVRMLEHAVVVVWIAACVVSLRCNRVLLLMIRTLKHAGEVVC